MGKELRKYNQEILFRKATAYQKHRQRIKISLDNQLIANSEDRAVELEDI